MSGKMLDKIIRNDETNKIYTSDEIDIFFQRINHFLKTSIYVFGPSVALHIGLSTILTIMFVGYAKVKLVAIYSVSTIVKYINADSLLFGGYSAENINQRLQKSFDGIYPKILLISLITSPAYLLSIKLFRKFKEAAKMREKRRHLRGKRLVEASEVLDEMKQNNKKGTIPIGVVIDTFEHPQKVIASLENKKKNIDPPSDEPFICNWSDYKKYYYDYAIKLVRDLESKGFLFIGATGTGKGLFMSAVVSVAYEWAKFAPPDKNGNPALPAKGIIYAAKGDEYFTQFFRPGKDILMNFCDVRGMEQVWNFFDEMEIITEAAAIADSLIPPMENVEPIWINAPRDIFEGLLLYCWKNNFRNYADLYRICTDPAEKIKEYLNGTEGAEISRRYVEDPTSKLCQSVLSCLAQNIKCFSLMSKNESTPFLISDWIENGDGFIYMPNQKSLRPVLRNFYSLFLDTFARKILSMDSDLKRRIFLFIDEFSTLNKCLSILEMLNQGRSKGMSIFIGIQGIPQIESIYGKNDCHALIAGCATKLIFNLGDEFSAGYIEKLLGTRDEMQIDTGFMVKPDDDNDSKSIRETEREKKVVTVGMLTDIPERHAFLLMRGIPLTFVQFPILLIPNKPEIPTLLIREDLKLENFFRDATESSSQKREQENKSDLGNEMNAHHSKSADEMTEIGGDDDFF